jgi:uncharacterized damage-inducible protein DinB
MQYADRPRQFRSPFATASLLPSSHGRTGVIGVRAGRRYRGCRWSLLASHAMTDFMNEDLSRSRFERVDLAGSRFRLTQFGGVEFHGCEFADTQLRIVEMNGVTMRGVEMHNVEISGDIGNLTINGVEVAGLVEAELDRRYPERVLMRPTDAAGFREAWTVLEQLWDSTVARARRLDPDRLHESVNGEWSFIETLRHLVLVTDGWIRRTVLGDASPWHPLGLPWDDPDETRSLPVGLTRDRAARPSLDTVLELRRDRMATVRAIVDGLSDESLDGNTTPVEAPGWPEPRARRLRNVLLHLFHEEWEHRLYAERDLNSLEDNYA